MNAFQWNKTDTPIVPTPRVNNGKNEQWSLNIKIDIDWLTDWLTDSMALFIEWYLPCLYKPPKG